MGGSSVLPLLTIYVLRCLNLARVLICSITESEIAPLKSQLEELDTEITEMVRLQIIDLIKFSARKQVSDESTSSLRRNPGLHNLCSFNSYRMI